MPNPYIPYDEIDYIEFPDKKFCFTGKFNYGTKKRCVEAVKKFGGNGKVRGDVCNNTNYLIVGKHGSPRWKHPYYGEKIAKALSKKEEGHLIFIVKEDTWAKALLTESFKKTA